MYNGLESSLEQALSVERDLDKDLDIAQGNSGWKDQKQGYVRDRGEEHSNQCGLSAA